MNSSTDTTPNVTKLPMIIGEVEPHAQAGTASAYRPSSAMWRYRNSYGGFCPMREEYPTCSADYDPAASQPTVSNANGIKFDEMDSHVWLYSPGGDPFKVLSETELNKYYSDIQNWVINGYGEGDFEIDFPRLIKRALAKRSTRRNTKTDRNQKTKKPTTKTGGVCAVFRRRVKGPAQVACTPAC